MIADTAEQEASEYIEAVMRRNDMPVEEGFPEAFARALVWARRNLDLGEGHTWIPWAYYAIGCCFDQGFTMDRRMFVIADDTLIRMEAVR